jgi:hypothetical protein
MWEPRHFTTLWAFTACYRNSCPLLVTLASPHFPKRFVADEQSARCLRGCRCFSGPSEHGCLYFTMRRVPSPVRNSSSLRAHVHQRTPVYRTAGEEIGLQRAAVCVRFTILYPIRFPFDFHGGWLKQCLLCVSDELLILISNIKFE